jgi:colanic acid/amylovoran biosynthesis protein
MLQIALERLGSFWPEASLEVLTDAPERLRALSPRAVPLPATGRRIWFGPLLPAVHRRLSRPASSLLRDVEAFARRKWSGSMAAMVRARVRVRGRDSEALDRFVEAARNADVLVVTGAGALNDEYAGLAVTILDLVDGFARRRAPTAMMGQGIGPLTHPRLVRRCREVLRRVDVIGLRERLMGPAILERAGVEPQRYIVTGDDALEFAHRLPVVPKESVLGVNLRRARYAGVDDAVEGTVQEAIVGFLRRHQIVAVPLPISFVEHEADGRSIQAVLGTDGLGEPRRWQAPEEVARLAGRCRLVFTGSYHAAVFALAQGTPVVAIAASPYYVQKFLGLVDLFGPGCHAVIADGPDLPGRLTAALEAAWGLDGGVAGSLRQAAHEQIQRSHSAYDRFREIVTSWRE